MVDELMLNEMKDKRKRARPDRFPEGKLVITSYSLEILVC